MNRFKPLLKKSPVVADVLPFGKIPGSKGVLGIGNFYNYFETFGKYSLNELHINGMNKYREYGPIVCERMIPGVSVVWLYDPNDIAQIFNEDPGEFPRRQSHLALEKYRKDRPDVYRTAGLLPTNGNEWWKIRSKFQKELSLPKNVRNFMPKCDEIVKDFLQVLPQHFDSNGLIEDFLDDLSRLNLELICQMTFDERLNSFSPDEYKPNSRSTMLMKAADKANQNTLPTDHGFQLWRLFETRSYRNFRESQEYIEQVAIDLVQKKLNQSKSDGNSLLDQYLKDPNVDVKDLYGMASDLLLGGVHTSSFTTSFLLYHIANNPRVQELLFQEALKILPNESDSFTSTINSEIPYTRAVLKESFRLNPISVGVGRILNKDMVLGGYHVPKNTIVVTQNMISCRLDKYFENALQFHPERWIKGNEQKPIFNPHLVLPFGHGMRSCIARRFAEQNILIFLLRLIRSYKIEWKGIREPLDVVTKLLNQPKDKITLKFEKR